MGGGTVGAGRGGAPEGCAGSGTFGRGGTVRAAGRDVTGPHCSPPVLCSRRLARMERRRRSPSAAPRGCQPSPPLLRWTRSRKRPRERINHRTRRCKRKGRGEQRASRLKWLTSKLRICPQKTERRKTRVQPLK